MNSILYKSFDYKGSGLTLIDHLRDEPYLFFLDSSQHEPNRGRYSFIGFDPFDIFVNTGKDTLAALKEKFARYAGGSPETFKQPFSPLTCGVVGCLGYDYGLKQENIRPGTDDDLQLPDAVFGFYDCIITIDHFTQKIHISSSGLPEKSGPLRKHRAGQRLRETVDKIAGALAQAEPMPDVVQAPMAEDSFLFEGGFSKQQYLAAVQKALDYIADGDIYQVNLSQRFAFDLTGEDFDPGAFYRTLRNIAPSPFGGYFDAGDFCLISNSPERFLRLNDRTVQTRPMKGTRPRGADPAGDKQLYNELVHSAKEKAELLMITDLLRNDIGRVCDYGSVRVREPRTIEEYKYVFQATSMIEGQLRREEDAFSLLRACFPGGSITGCPKIRSMQIIDQLEPTRRGFYTGTMGYISFDGCMDLNILIRTLLMKDSKLYFQVGGGIVADSVPEKEYDETIIKAWSMRASLQSVFGPDKTAVKRIKR